MKTEHIQADGDAYSTFVHDMNRDDIDWPTLFDASWRQDDYDFCKRIRDRVRERIEEYEVAAEIGHFEACEFVAECAEEVA